MAVLKLLLQMLIAPVDPPTMTFPLNNQIGVQVACFGDYQKRNVVQDALGECGLTSVDVGGDANDPLLDGVEVDVC